MIMIIASLWQIDLDSVGLIIVVAHQAGVVLLSVLVAPELWIRMVIVITIVIIVIIIVIMIKLMMIIGAIMMNSVTVIARKKI